MHGRPSPEGSTDPLHEGAHEKEHVGKPIDGTFDNEKLKTFDESVCKLLMLNFALRQPVI